MLATRTEISEAEERLRAVRKATIDGAWPEATRLSKGDLERFTRQLGITRVADLTDLDTLGVPVWAAARPASRSLCVAAGKGTTHDQAWISAVLESAEQALAEDATTLVSVVCSPSDLERQGLRCLPLERQSRCAAGWLSPDRELGWVRGLSWSTGDWVYAPYELVGMDMTTRGPWNTRQFRMSSVGLASGADLASAITHGLSELVEDDAMFAALLAPTSAEGELVLDPVRGRHLRAIIDGLAAAGVDARFVQVRWDADLAVVIAALVPHDAALGQQAYYCGSACDVRVEDAALGALLEAVQCRAIFISGARDDLFASDYSKALAAGTRQLFDRSRIVWRAAQADATATLDLPEALAQANIGDFYVFPIGGRRFGFDAVRVLADDLVSLYAPDGYSRTGRAAATLLRRWSDR